MASNAITAGQQPGRTRFNTRAGSAHADITGRGWAIFKNDELEALPEEPAGRLTAMMEAG